MTKDETLRRHSFSPKIKADSGDSGENVTAVFSWPTLDSPENIDETISRKVSLLLLPFLS